MLSVSVSVSSATSTDMGSDAELDSELLETETGWRFFSDDDDEGSIQAFDNGTAPAPAPAPAASTKLPSGQVALINGDFEQTNVSSNATTLADVTATTMIPNWLPGGAGVQVLPPPSLPLSLNLHKTQKAYAQSRNKQ